MRIKTYYNDDVFEYTYKDKDYRIELEAAAEEIHTPGCIDPNNSYPPEDDFELKSVDAVWYLVTDEDEIEVQPTKEMAEALEDWLREHSNLFKAEEE